MSTHNNYYIEKNLVDFTSLLQSLNNLSQIVSKYLGPKLTSQYWEASRPQYAWSKNFEINSKAKISFTGNFQALTPSIYYFCMRQWTEEFMQECSQIMRDLPQLVAQHLSSHDRKLELFTIPTTLSELTNPEAQENNLFWDHRRTEVYSDVISG